MLHWSLGVGSANNTRHTSWNSYQLDLVLPNPVLGHTPHLSSHTCYSTYLKSPHLIYSTPILLSLTRNCPWMLLKQHMPVLCSTNTIAVKQQTPNFYFKLVVYINEAPETLKHNKPLSCFIWSVECNGCVCTFPPRLTHVGWFGLFVSVLSLWVSLSRHLEESFTTELKSYFLVVVSQLRILPLLFRLCNSFFWYVWQYMYITG